MTALIPSAGQQLAHDVVGRFRNQDEEHVAVITGYAGTGKTTLIRQLADSYGTPTVTTPTGKAALRVGEATGIFGMTIHRFLYEPSEDPKTGAPVFKLKSPYDETFADMRGALVIVDEASMVPPDVWMDLHAMAHRVGFYLVLMGDPFQLPPVHKDSAGTPFSALNVKTSFRANLTEVIRQAQESPIIRASMILRSGQPDYEALMLLNPMGSSRLIESAIECRQRRGTTICFTNARRHDINKRVREALGYQPDTIEYGEPLLVTQNNYDLNVYNGEIVDFEGWSVRPREDDTVTVTDRATAASLKVHFGIVSFGLNEATVCPEQVTGRIDEARISPWNVRKAARYWYRKGRDSEERMPHLDVTYGEALTCHKAQGSEWDEVLVVMDKSTARLRGTEWRRWLYTAITRAKLRANYIYVED